MKKRVLALLLCLMMLVSLFPMAVLAEGTGSIAALEQEEDDNAPAGGTIAPAEEPDPAEPAGADASEEPTTDPEALPAEPVADEKDATSGKCGYALDWSLENGVLTITGSGEMVDWNDYSNVPWYSYRSNITSLVLPEGLSSIGSYAFYSCSNLTSVDIPANVELVGTNAFSGCSKLAAVYIHDLAAWCQIAFSTSDANPLYYAKKLYLNGTQITDLAIPEGVTSIKYGVFYNCSSLTSVTIPSTVTSIGKSAFYNCSGLPGVTVPEGVTSIGSYAFKGCSSLMTVEIPSTLTSIGEDAFSSCSNLSAVYIRDLAAWCAISFGGTYSLSSSYSYFYSNPLTYAKKLYLNGKRITDLVIPEGVTSIEYGAFFNCSALTSVTIPSTVTSIGNGAFGNCSGLKKLVFLGKAPTIGGYSFYSVTATAYYPSDSSWTSSVRSNYGGTLTWVKGYSVVTFDANGGETPAASKTVMYTAPYGELPTPVREGYSFAGWYTAASGGTKVTAETVVDTTADHTLYAHWTVASYTVTYDANGGEGAPAAQAKTPDQALTLSSQQPTRADAPAGGYTVTLDPKGGEVSETSLTAERTEHFSFSAWNTAADGSGDSYAPGASYTANAALTLYAQWNSELSTAAVTLPTPTRTGFSFKGWAADATAATGTTGSFTPEGDVTLYAIWESDAERPSFRVGEGKASAGKQVEIPITVENDPGIYALTVSFRYDTSALELVSVTPNTDAFPGTWQTGSLTGATWTSNAGDITANGTILTLTFEVLEGTEDGEYSVEVTLDEVINEDMDDIDFTAAPGKVIVSSHTPGDVNGDGKVSTKDFVTLMKYLAGEDVTVVEDALDVNGDGKVSTKDFVTLMKYLAGEDVTIY